MENHEFRTVLAFVTSACDTLMIERSTKCGMINVLLFGSSAVCAARDDLAAPKPSSSTGRIFNFH